MNKKKAKISRKQSYKNPNLPVKERVRDLLSRMTLDEKVAQLMGCGMVAWRISNRKFSMILSG